MTIKSLLLPLTGLAAGSLLSLALAGCGSPAANAPQGAATHDHEHGAAEHGHDEHDHASTGPHAGTLIELGEYHAELVHDEQAGTVTVYILDGAAAENVPVDAKEATINITHDGKGIQVPLAASPLEGEPAGWSSRFVSSEAHLGDVLHEAAAEAVFVVSINGTSHRGKIESHHHDGDGHDHGHSH